MLDQLTALDATFLELEQMDEGATMHIGGVMVFDPLPDGGAPALDAVRDDIAARLTSLPRYTQRLSAEHVGGLAWPRWQADPSFDLRNHVHRAAVPAPGGDPELCEWAAEYFSHRLDRTRPLWEMVLVEGLAEGRWAIATKTHHALVDGVGSVDALNVMLAPEPPAPSAEQQSNETRAGWEAIVPHPPRAVVDLTRSGARAAAGGLHAALHPREAFEKSRALAEVIVHDAITGAPQTSLNVPIGPTRRYEIVRIPLEELKAIGHEFGGSLNDAVLAACATGLRKLLIARNEQLPSAGLRAMVPVNIRTAPEHLALGNRISSLFVELPVAEPLAHARARQIVERMTALKSSRAALGAATAVDVSSLAPPILHPLLARTLYGTRLFNLTITNVPGPSEALYACGAPLREVHPLVPLAAEHAVGVAVMSCNGSVVLGLSADCDSMPDFDVFVDGVRGGLDELRGLLAGSSDAGPAGRTPARRTEPVRASR